MKTFHLERMVRQVVRSPACVYYTTRIAQIKGFKILTYFIELLIDIFHIYSFRQN